MCIYHYCYYSACQHGELTRISYCDETAALGLPLLDRRSRRKANVGSSSRDQHATSSLPPSTVKASSISPYKNTQQQLQNKFIMSTLTLSKTGCSPTLYTNVHDDEQTLHQASLIPRSTLIDEERARREMTLSHARSLLDSQGFSDVCIDIPLDTQSSLQRKSTHNVSPNTPPCASNCSVRLPTSRTSPGQEHVLEEIDDETVTRTVGRPDQTPRKSLPAHWLPKPVSPKLATAQRAKERTHKKQSESGSPGHMKTLRSTQSSVELGKSHGKESVTYLTKEALAAVEPVALSSAVKAPISPKRAWNSPTLTQRGVVRQPMSSPTKPTHLTTGTATANHSRASSSVATSTSKVSFYTAEGSPVSPPDTERSFWSAADDFEDLFIHVPDLNADMQNEQIRNVDNSSVSGVKANGERMTLPRAKLTLHIPVSHVVFDPDSELEVLSTGGDCPAKTSRIPRVGGTAKASTASRIPALQRTRSVQTIRSKAKIQAMYDEIDETRLDSTESKPKAEQIDTNWEQEKTAEVDPQGKSVKHTHFWSADDRHHTELDVHENNGHETSPTLSDPYGRSEGSRQVSSNSSLHVSPDVTDPILKNPSVIYCRKKEDVPGSNQPDSTSHNATSAIDVFEVDRENTEPARTRKDRVSSLQTEVDGSVLSQHKMGSDLRATAAEFVPQLPSTTPLTEAATESITLESLQDVPGLPDMSVLDRNAIPFLWYMYAIQFAYDQGFRNGRPKPPRKYKPRKMFGTGSPGDGSTTVSCQPSVTEMPKAVRHFPAPEQPVSCTEYTTPPTSTHALHSITAGNDIQTNFHNKPVYQVSDTVESQPFVNQLDNVGTQSTLTHPKDTSTPRHYNIDLTQVRNTGFPTGPRSHQSPTYYTMPRFQHRNNRYPRNGLYGGRGNTAGIPIDDTAPFPSPIPPQGRLGRTRTRAGNMTDCSGYAIAKEACGMVDITSGVEVIGGVVCNGCEPGH